MRESQLLSQAICGLTMLYIFLLGLYFSSLFSLRFQPQSSHSSSAKDLDWETDRLPPLPFRLLFRLALARSDIEPSSHGQGIQESEFVHDI
jgi:hypothetical protein